MVYLKSFIAGTGAFAATLMIWVKMDLPTGIDIGETLSAIELQKLLQMLGSCAVAFLVGFYLMLRSGSAKRQS